MKEIIYLNNHREPGDHTTPASEIENAALQTQPVQFEASTPEKSLRASPDTDTDFERTPGVPVGEVVDLVEIHKAKERQKKLQDEFEKEELRAQLRWVLDKIHQKNITYEEEDEETAEYDDGDPSLSGGWFSRMFRRNGGEIDP